MLEPTEIKVGPHTYMLGRLDMFEALDVCRRAAPILPVLFHEVLSKVALEVLKSKDEGEASAEDRIDELGRLISMSQPALKAIAAMPREDYMTIIRVCLSCAERKVGKTWAKVVVDGNLMFSDIEQADVLQIVIRVLGRELRPTIAALLGLGGAAASTSKATSESSPTASTT